MILKIILDARRFARLVLSIEYNILLLIKTRICQVVLILEPFRLLTRYFFFDLEDLRYLVSSLFNFLDSLRIQLTKQSTSQNVRLDILVALHPLA